MKKLTFLLLIVFLAGTAFKTGKPAYLIFDGNNKKAKYSQLLKQAQDADVILFGELHNNPISHWLQLELTKDLHTVAGANLILGAEMFESDNQIILDEYLNDVISQSRFEAEARLWTNYKTDYKPIVEFAKENKLKFVATNIPRRYASIVNTKGFEGLEELSEEAKMFLPPLPVLYNPELNAYKNMMTMSGMEHHSSENFPKAQAVKDATMAYFILKNWVKEKKLIHFHGAYHSDNFESIYWYLKQHNPELQILTITTVSQNDISEVDEENKGKANFIICVDKDMTSTH
jgi:uncharacterized iron-regulated protein